MDNCKVDDCQKQLYTAEIEGLRAALEAAREFIDSSDEAPRQRDRLLQQIDSALFSVTNGDRSDV